MSFPMPFSEQISFFLSNSSYAAFPPFCMREKGNKINATTKLQEDVHRACLVQIRVVPFQPEYTSKYTFHRRTFLVVRRLPVTPYALLLLWKASGSSGCFWMSMFAFDVHIWHMWRQARWGGLDCRMSSLGVFTKFVERYTWRGISTAWSDMQLDWPTCSQSEREEAAHFWQPVGCWTDNPIAGAFWPGTNRPTCQKRDCWKKLPKRSWNIWEVDSCAVN